MTQYTPGTVHPDRYWWHNSIARELRRLRYLDTPAYNVKGIADNVSMLELDVRRHLEEMLEWGEVRKAEPLWDYAPNDWYALEVE